MKTWDTPSALAGMAVGWVVAGFVPFWSIALIAAAMIGYRYWSSKD